MQHLRVLVDETTAHYLDEGWRAIFENGLKRWVEK
jgi:hypothetical protein